MNFKKAINYDELKVFFESKGFSVKSESGGVVFSSPYGYHIAVSQSRKDEDMIYLDCNLINTVGLQNFIREWPKGTNLYDYLVNICYPIIRNLKGCTTMDNNPDSVIDCIKSILKEKNISYTYSDSTELKYILCHPLRECYENRAKQKIFLFNKNDVKYGIILKQFNTIYFARFKDDSDTVLFEYPWYAFCPIYKEGESYIRTTIENILEFVEQDPKVV